MNAGLSDTDFYTIVNAVTSRCSNGCGLVDRDGLRVEIERVLGGLVEQLEVTRDQDDALDRAYQERDDWKAETERLKEQLEAVQRWFHTKPWDGPLDRSSLGGHDYTERERAMGYGTYRDPRFLPSLLSEVSSPASSPKEVA